MLKFLNNNIHTKKRSLRDQLILFACGISCVFMFPFSIYRLLIEDYSIAAIDFLIGVGLVTIFIQTWRSSELKYLNTIAVTSFMMGVLWVMQTRGLSMIFWAFPTMGFTYFVLRSREAILLNTLFILVITYIFFAVLTKNQALSIYPSLILACLFGYGFSLCSESQNKKQLKLVSEDTLTEVKNRRSFDDKIEEVLEQNKRTAMPVCLLLLDLDFFKKINDNYGHKQGDKVLFDFAQRVKLMIRNTDYIYRFGGEEFVIIATNLKLENAFSFADSIRETVELTPSLAKYNVTVSIGVSEINKADDADSWFRRTDLALYEAKSQGRNRVCLAAQNESGDVHFIQSNLNKDVKYPSRKSADAECNINKEQQMSVHNNLEKIKKEKNLDNSTIS